MQRGSPIVVVGSSNSDMIIQLDHLPRPGETVIGGKFSTAAGGKGANQAVAAARAGGRVAFVARVGGDELGAAALAGFRRDGIDVRHVSRDPAHRSGVAFILVDRHGENSIAVASGANGHLRPADVRKAAPLLRRAGVLLTQLETPLTAVTAAVELVSAAGGTVILNPAPGRPLPRRLLRQVSVLTPNESEAELLTGIKLTHHVAVEKAAARLRALGARAVVITLAARGVTCGQPEITVNTDGLRPGAAVTVTVSCHVPLSDLGLIAVPGTRVVTATSSSPVDLWRGNPS